MATNYRGVTKAGGGFNSLAAGKKLYGSKTMPTVGPVRNRLGYAKRDQALKMRNNALLKYGQKRMAN